MAILIERATTPVFASAMNTDSNSDGVVDGFTSYVDSGITATFSLNDSAQKIEITASANAGNTGVYTGFITVSASTAYSLQVLLRGSITAGAPTLRVYLNWYDASNTFISTSSVSDTTITTYWKVIRLENVTSPANAAKAQIALRIAASVAGDTGAVWFRNVMLEQSTICSTFTTTTRAADSAYIDIAPLTGEWALSGAFALPYDSSISGSRTLLVLYLNTNNQIYLWYNPTSAYFQFAKIVNGTTYYTLINTAFSRYNIHKFIISQANSGMHMFIRQNNKATMEAHNTNTDMFVPTRLYVGHQNVVYQPNAFIESLTLYRNKAITTLAEADAIFDSMNAELVVNGNFSNGSTGWSLYNGAVVENGMLKRVATEASGTKIGAASQSIKVLPNNIYKVSARIIGRINSQNYPQIVLDQYDVFNTTYISNSVVYLIPTTSDQKLDITVTTGPNSYYLLVVPYSVGSGTFYWDDISIKLVN